MPVLDDAIKQIRKFSPSLLAVSAGFDTYADDPLTNIILKKESYHRIMESIAALKINFFCVLEGGYSSELKDCIYEFLRL